MSAVKTNVEEGSGRTPAEIMLAANLRNIAAKLKEGKTLSASEIRLLQDMEAGNESPSGESDLAKNQVQLAALLGVNRKTIERYKKLPGAPVPRPNGKLSVSEWRAFLASHSVVDDEDEIDASKEKAKNLRLQNEKLAEQLKILREEYVPIVDVERDVGEMIQNAKSILLSGPASLAPQVVGLTIPEAEKLLRDWLHDALSKLQSNPLGKEVSE